jgi:PTH1 family peptidyl-tRNA hydrolase
MNRSGLAVRILRERFPDVQEADLLVVTDDLDLPLGAIRFRRSGGDGGHRGLRSVIEELGSREFPRLRLGIGRPGSAQEAEVVDYVLEPFLPEEEEAVAEVLKRAQEGVRTFLASGIEAAMNRFNAGASPRDVPPAREGDARGERTRNGGWLER